MPTKVFISWSGDLSRRLGEALRKWLPAVLQYVKPYFTPDDIEKGAKWNTDIARELDEANIGLICLTRDNTEKAWILFEAGALSKSFEKSRVCTILFNLDTTDLRGPLTGFQTTRFNKEDIKRLVETINSAAGEEKLEPHVLDSVFDMWWPGLERDVSEILASRTEDDQNAHRPDRDILEEILALTRMRVSSPSRPPAINPRVIMDLVEGVEELFFLQARSDVPLGRMVIPRIVRATRELCMVFDMRHAFERLEREWRHVPLARDGEIISNDGET